MTRNDTFLKDASTLSNDELIKQIQQATAHCRRTKLNLEGKQDLQEEVNIYSGVL